MRNISQIHFLPWNSLLKKRLFTYSAHNVNIVIAINCCNDVHYKLATFTGLNYKFSSRLYLNIVAAAEFSATLLKNMRKTKLQVWPRGYLRSEASNYYLYSIYDNQLSIWSILSESWIINGP